MERTPLKASRRSYYRWLASSGNKVKYEATKDQSSSLTSDG